MKNLLLLCAGIALLAGGTFAARAQQTCDAAYPGVCIPPAPPDLDCKDIASLKNFRVLPPDPHRFDGDFDGIGCEPPR